MSRLFTSGFEENDLSASTTIWTNTGAGCTLVTTAPHSGTYHLQQAGTSGKAQGRDLGVSYTTGTMVFRWYWRTNAAGIFDSRLFSNRSSGGTQAAQVQKLSTGKIRLLNAVAANQVDSTMTISADTWYRFELQHVLSDTGSLVLKIYAGDATTESDTLTLNGGGSGEDVLPINIRQFFFEETANSNSLTYYVDDVAVNISTDTGDGQTSWPGPGKNAIGTPNGDTTVAWTKGGTPQATNYEGVDEVPGNIAGIDTDYNSESGTTNEDKLAFSNLPAEVPSDAVMKVMDVYARVGLGAAGSGTIALKVWNESGSGTEGPTMTINSTTARILTAAEHQTYNLTGKTKANVDSFSLGYIAKSGAVEKRVYAVWANIEWLENTVTSPAPSANDTVTVAEDLTMHMPISLKMMKLP